MNTTDDVKFPVQRQEGIPVDQQRLFFEGNQPEDGRALQGDNIGMKALST
ncbi:Ubiquitin-related domain [Phytophthora cactorum]|nr:Ubiquitin-related domain [Phytophthora cactorum]